MDPHKAGGTNSCHTRTQTCTQTWNVQLAAKPAAASSSIPVADGQHVQLFKTMWDQKKKFYTVPVQQ